MSIELMDVSYDVLKDRKPFRVLDGLNLRIETGEFICLLGPSGCGKSTLLHAMAGFTPPADGRILDNGQDVRAPSSRRILLFQEYGLLPWRNVRKNVELGLESLPLSRRERAAVADRYIDMVGLGPFRNSRPAQLSGGMQQRVALARALAVSPEVLLMDEPLGALDALTRMRMQQEILDIWLRCNPTVVFVTHSIEEAVFLAQRIVILTPVPGRIQSVIPVSCPHPRDRTSPAFLAVRDRIFAGLGMKNGGGTLLK